MLCLAFCFIIENKLVDRSTIIFDAGQLGCLLIRLLSYGFPADSIKGCDPIVTSNWTQFFEKMWKIRFAIIFAFLALAAIGTQLKDESEYIDIGEDAEGSGSPTSSTGCEDESSDCASSA